MCVGDVGVTGTDTTGDTTGTDTIGDTTVEGTCARITAMDGLALTILTPMLVKRPALYMQLQKCHHLLKPPAQWSWRARGFPGQGSPFLRQAAMNWISWMHRNEGQMIPRTEQVVKSKLRLHRINSERFSWRGKGEERGARKESRAVRAEY